MIFELGTNRFETNAPAQYPAVVSTKLIQAKDTSASGIVHVESFNVIENKYTYVFVDASESVYIGIMEWFINIAQGMLNVFTLTDDLGIVRTVRFLDSQLEGNNTAFQLWDITFSVEVV